MKEAQTCCIANYLNLMDCVLKNSTIFLKITIFIFLDEKVLYCIIINRYEQTDQPYGRYAVEQGGITDEEREVEKDNQRYSGDMYAGLFHGHGCAGCLHAGGICKTKSEKRDEDHG